MTFTELLAEVETKIKFDGAASAPIDVEAVEYILAVQKLLKKYTRKVFEIYLLRQTLTVEIDDIVVRLPQYMFKTAKVWCTNQRLEEVTKASLYQGSVELPAAGVPTKYCDVEDGTLTFNCPLSQTAVEGLFYVEGWAEHPDITDPDDPISVADRFSDEITDYIASELMLPVASDDITIGRMRTYAASAKRHMRQRRGMNLSRDLE